MRFILTFIAMILDLLFPSDTKSIEDKIIYILAKKVRVREAIDNQLLVFKSSFLRIRETIMKHRQITF